MPEVVYRPAPPLLAHIEAGGKAFREYFRPGGVPRDIEAPSGRLVRFDAKNEGVYSQFFKARRPDTARGSPVQRWSWLEDTLTCPTEIWKQARNPRPVEFYLSRYELTDGSRLHYFVMCHVSERAAETIVEPRTEILDRTGEEWKRVIGPCHLVWPETGSPREEEESLHDKVESLAELLGEGDQVLIVGPMRDQLPGWISGNASVIIWPSTDLKGACPVVPAKVKFILLSRFVNHRPHGEELSKVAHERNFPIRKVNYAQIKSHCRGWAPEDDQ